MSLEDIIVTRMGARFLGRRLPCAIGRGDLTANKREGDGATPVGTHRILGVMYRPDRMHAPANWAEPIRVGDLWSDASDDADYNQLVRAPYGHSCEQMRRPDPLYDLVMVTDWNYPTATAGKGSAIFVHTWRKPRHPTAGCVAFSRPDLLWLAANIVPGTRLIVKT